MDADIDRIACRIAEGQEVSQEERDEVVINIKARIENGEIGDDLPILMGMIGCDYDEACDAVFSEDRKTAHELIDAAVLAHRAANGPRP